jgi:delta 1-pyrroline-5-carboxylate dehydrogenase
MRRLFKFLLILACAAAALWVVHTFWITPFCYYTYAAEMWVKSFDVSAITGTGEIELGTISGIGSLAGGATYLWRKAVSKANTLKQQATEKIGNLTSDYNTLETTAAEQEQKLTEAQTQIETQVQQVTSAQEAQKAAEDIVASKDEQIKNLRSQLDTLNNLSAKAQALGENVDKLKVIEKVI